MSRKIKYHKAFSFKDLKGNEHTMASQLYHIGVYAIFNNDPRMQSNNKPSTMASRERKLIKAEKAKEITDLKLMSLIEVHEVDGLWEEYIEPVIIPEDYTETVNTLTGESTVAVKCKYVFTKFGLQFFVHILGNFYSINEWATGAVISMHDRSEEHVITLAKKRLARIGKVETLDAYNKVLKTLETINKPYKI